MPDAIILNVDHLRKIFKSGSQTIDVLDDISFQIEPGCACPIVGPSGSGKTTLIAICAGLERPTSGSVILNGTAVHEASEDGLARLRNHEVGFIFQSFQLLPSLTLPEVQQLNRALVTCGASIAEVNTIRKHVSAVKGGRLAQAAAPASVITLAISDVPVGKESALASGPTLPDPTTCDEVADILTKYDLRARLPASLVDWIGNGKMPETPKSSEPSPGTVKAPSATASRKDCFVRSSRHRP
jgi:ABC-type Fe3+/spermidine/putrescine transport system ATPase subunit